MFRFILVVLLMQCLSSFGQEYVQGVVISEDQKGRLKPVSFANVYWLGTNYGTTTDSNGVFNLAIHSSSRKLVTSFVGYQSDTLLIEDLSATITVQLSNAVSLNTVQIEAKRKSTEMSFINPLKMENMSER